MRIGGSSMFLILPAVAYVGDFLKTFREYPPRQKPGSFNLDAVIQTLQEGGNGLPSN
jgi:hypothetical protein